jgi:hypothetical protein
MVHSYNHGLQLVIKSVKADTDVTTWYKQCSMVDEYVPVLPCYKHSVVILHTVHEQALSPG